MASSRKTPEREFDNAERIYSSFLKRLQEGEDVDFDALLAEHPTLQRVLRALNTVFEVGRTCSASRSFRQAIQEELGGDVDEITISLDPESTVPESERAIGAGAGAREAGIPTDPRRRYVNEAAIAGGGMGTIYRVRDRELNRTLAMKVLSRRSGDGSTRPHKVDLARFLEEAQVTAQLDHPGIVPVHEFGLDAAGRLYFTMKLVKGRELGEIFRLARAESEGWNIPRAVGVLVKACQAVAYAHSKGVIHRDLKPANIMVGRFGEVFVMDWGLAKVVGREDTHDLRLHEGPKTTSRSIRTDRKSATQSAPDSPLITVDGTVVGTPAYMSPEQARGQIEDIDVASDIYGLGAILYSLLAGHPPYVEENARLSPHTLLAAVTQGPPRRVHDCAERVPLELAAICEKAMARDRKRRYRSCLDMAEDLQAYLDGRVVKAFRTGAVAELRSWIGRNRATAITAAVALVLALGGLLATSLVQKAANVKIAGERDAVRREHYYGSIALADRYILSGQQDRALEALFSCAPERRNWEWGYCLRRCNQAVLTFDQSRARVESFEFTADASRLAVRRADGTLNLWSLEDGENLLRLGSPKDGDRIVWFSLSPDGSCLATAGPGTSSRLYDTRSGEELPPLVSRETVRVRAVAFSSDGKRLATARADDTTDVWDVAKRQLLLTVSGPTDLSRADFSPDGTRLITRGTENSIVWDAETGAELFTPRIPRHGDSLHSLAPDGSRFIVAKPDGTAALFDAETGARTRVLRGPPDPLIWVGFLTDGRAVGTLSRDRSFGIWDSETGEKLGAFEGPVLWGDMTRDLRVFVTSSGNRTAKLWDREGRELMTFRGHTAIVEQVILSRDGRLVATEDRDGTVKVWCSDVRREFLDAGSGVLAVAFSPDGKRIATGHWDARVRVWDAASGQLLLTVKRYFQHVRAVVFEPDGELIAAAGGDGIIDLFSAANGRSWLTLEGHERLVSCLAFSPDGKRIASGSNDTTLRIWSVVTGETTHTLKGHSDKVTSVAFSADGRWLASGSWDRTARVWDAATGRELAVLSCGTDYVHTVAFSPDGERIATAGEKTIRIWDRSSGTVDASFDARSFVHTLAWSPDGSRLVSVSGENEWGLGFPSLDVWDPENRRELLTTLRADSGFYYGVTFATDGRRILAGGWRPADDSARLLEAFPWRGDDYPGDASEPLRTRVQRYARGYWRERLNAGRAADRSGHHARELEMDRSIWPARDPSTPSHLIDLSRRYNALLTTSWYSLGSTYADRNDLKELPRGTVTLLGTLFDVRGVVQLASRERTLFPPRADDIEVGRRFRRLHVLHATVEAARDGEVVGGFILHYPGGDTRELPLVYGKDTRNWHEPRDAAAVEAGDTVVAWQGTNPYAESQNCAVRLFKSTFENPRPDLEVGSIDFVSKLTSAAPFLVAMTVEE